MITNPSNPKQVKSFWGIVIVFVVGMVAGGVILMVAFNNQLQDEINSVNFFGRRENKAVNKTVIDKQMTPTTTEVTK